MSTIVIRVNGYDITPDVVLEDAKFTSQASGAAPGMCWFRLKDKNNSYTFVVGSMLTLDIDGVRVWGGWIQNVSRQFFFPYTGASGIGSKQLKKGVVVPCIGVATETPRAWVIEGIDYNILFRKRYCSNKANRPDMELKSWAAGTHDDVQIRYLCQYHLDLEGDGLDCTSMVEYVGTPNPDARGNSYGASWSWEDAMNAISNYPGAIYYIDAQKRLVYTDVDTISAAYGLSDVPGVGQLGYRDMEILYNGSNLMNDALVWGVGQGSDKTKFKRVRDTTSMNSHGLWQVGDFRSDMWRQASVDRRANGFVYGSPQNKRGGKDDAVSVIATLFEPAFSAGQKVDFHSNVFGYSDVIPIRQMTVTFPTTTDAKFDLMLSHNIDQPWNTSEFWFPKIEVPIPEIKVKPPKPDEYCPVPDFPRTFEVDGQVTSLGSGGFRAVFTDDFNRLSGTQPNNEQYGYWVYGNYIWSQVKTAPTFNENGLTLSHNAWSIFLAEAVSSDLQLILKMNVGGNFNVGSLFGVYNGNVVVFGDGTGGYGVRSSFVPTGNVFIRFVYFKGFYAAVKIWPQGQPEPFEWSATGAVTDHDHVDNFFIPFTGIANLQSVTVFSNDEATPQPTPEAFSQTYIQPGNLAGGWTHTFDTPSDGNFSGASYGTMSSTRSAGPNASQGVGVVWPYFTIGEQCVNSAGQTIVSYSTPLHPLHIRISGRVRCTVGYSGGISVDGLRPEWTAPVTVNFDVYNYGSGEPYWMDTPYYAAQGRTALSIEMRPSSNKPGVEADFSFDVPADEMVQIGENGFVQWGVKVWDPRSALSPFPQTPGAPFMLANGISIEVITLGTPVYSIVSSFIGGATYFCTPLSSLGGTNDQRVCETFSSDSSWMLIEHPEMYAGITAREIRVSSPYVAMSVELIGDGQLAQYGVDFVETDASIGAITLLNDFMNVKTIVACYFPVSTALSAAETLAILEELRPIL